MVKKNHEEFKPKRKVSREGFAWCLYLMGANLLRMVLLSLILTVCCVTVVFAPAAITGANRSLLILLRGRGGLFWDDFREDFLDRFLKKLGMWLLMMLLPVAVGLWLYILGADVQSVKIVIAVGLLLSLVLQSYFFTLVAALKLPLETCLRNAVLLVFLEWRTSIVFFLFYALVIFVSYLTFPYCIPVLSFILISCMMMVICQQVRRIILRRGLYLPEENKNTKEPCDESAAEGEETL